MLFKRGPRGLGIGGIDGKAVVEVVVGASTITGGAEVRRTGSRCVREHVTAEDEWWTSKSSLSKSVEVLLDCNCEFLSGTLVVSACWETDALRVLFAIGDGLNA